MNLARLLANHKLHDRITFRGLNISIENRKGSVRQGVDRSGKAWSSFYWIPYGYIRGTMGVDGDQVDCFVGPNEDAKNVYVIHVRDPHTNKYDEDKCMLGFSDADEAKRQFMRHYNNGNFFGGMDTLSWDDFERKVLGTKDKPCKLTASGNTLSIGDEVAVNGIQYRGVVKKIHGKMIYIEYKSQFKRFQPVTIVRSISQVTKI